MNDAIKISSSKAGALVENYKGNQFFTVTFIKRSNGESRVMNCRKGVKKHLKGGEKAYDPKAKRLVCVYDIKASGYRSIPLENITNISMEGKDYETI